MKTLITALLAFLTISCHQVEKKSTITGKVEPSKTSFDVSSLIGQDYLMDDQHSYIGFKIKYFGFSPVRGRFDNFNGTLFFDPSNIDALSASVTVDVNSINTGNKTRDSDLKKEDTWFDAQNFSQIKFISSHAISDSNGAFDLVGDLSIKGRTKTITISFEKPSAISQDWAENDQVDFSGRFTIDRQDFNVFGGDFWSSVMENGLTQLSDHVEIEIDIHCRRANYQKRYEALDSLNVRKIALDNITTEGIDIGIDYIDKLYKNDELSPGILSTIGYTLNSFSKYEEAIKVFERRMQYFPKSLTSLNQLGVTELLRKNNVQAREYFLEMTVLDTTDSRALEYIRLTEHILEKVQ